MANISDALNEMTADLRGEFDVAWQQVVQQGNLYPLIEFYNRNELKLQQDYGINLNELLGFNPNNLNIKPTNSAQPKVREQLGNPLTDLALEDINKTSRGFSLISILALSGGLFLIIKSFKK